MTLYSLQFLRFVAALFVVLFHLALMSSGYKGVDIFFVISGFVMYYSGFVVARKSAVAFFVNRLTKIFLLYWIALLLYYFIAPYKINYPFIKTIFLFPGHVSVLGVSWSLSYELYFYFLFGGIIYFLQSKNYKVVFLILLTASTLVTILNTLHPGFKGGILNFLLGENCWEFLSGILAGYLFTTQIKKITKNITLIVVIISGILITYIDIRYGSTYSCLVYGPLSFLLVGFITILQNKIFIPARIQSIINTLGNSSYAIYLLGPVIIGIINPYSFIVKILSIIVLIAVSILINQLVENKLLRLLRKMLPGKNKAII